MRSSWIPVLLTVATLGPFESLNAQQLEGAPVETVQDQSVLQPQGAGPAEPAAAEGLSPGAPAFGNTGFQPRQPLGAFQPTDVGAGDPQPSLAPEAPQAFTPDPQAAPAEADRQPSLRSHEPQAVAPAQFQAPVQPKTSREPETTVVPNAAAPAFQPAAPPAQPEPQSLTQSLYQQAISPPQAGALAGTPLTLHDALSRRTDSSRYAEFVKAYWELSRAIAAYHEHLQGAAELSRLPQPRLPHEQAILQAARSAVEAEVRQARLQALSAQFELGEQISGDFATPLPDDLPLLAAYKSKFDAVFAGRVPPPGARRLHETFEPRLAVIEGRAAAVVAVENGFGALGDAYANGQVALGDVLHEHARLQAARTAFLRSVYDYNAAIADYAYLAAGPHRSPETIVSMLVERRKPAESQNVAPANFNAPNSR